MPTLDELLNASNEVTTCTVNPDTREIIVPEKYKILGVFSDEKVTKIPFTCPKVVGNNVDLTEYKLYINYQNAIGGHNAYLVDDVEVSGDNITFSWLLSRDVTLSSGVVKYSLCAKKLNGDLISNEWNTTIANGIVIQGLEVTQAIIEENPDIIEAILSKAHTHANKSVLDKFAETDGKPTYDGKDLGGSDASVTEANITSALGYKPVAPGDIPVVPTADISANTSARHSHINKDVLDSITSADKTIVDTAISDTSTNPVQNKVIKKYIDDHNFLPEPIPNGDAVQTLAVDRNSRTYKLMTFDNLELPGASESTNAPQTRSVKYLLDRKASKDAATEESDGLMSAVDKIKLDGIEDGANKTVVDASLDATSTNPVQNKAVKAALDTKAGTAVATASSNGLMSKDDKTKLDGVEDGANKTTVDAALDAASENPVQNKAVKAALDGKLDKTGGTLTGNLRVTGALFSGDGLSFGTGENIHFTKAADDAGKLAHGAAGVDDTVPLARLKVASPTEDDDAATKAYVDNNAAGAGAVRYDAAQTLDFAQKGRARTNIGAVGYNSPQFQGFLSLAPANAPLGTGVGLSPSGSGNDFTLDISDVNENTPTLLTGVKTPTDADTNAAATVEYVKATVPTALKNPNALTIKIGSTTVTYDGSAAKTVEIADGSEVSY